MPRDMNCLSMIENSSAKKDLRGKNRLLIDHQDQRLSNKKTLKKQAEAFRDAGVQVIIEAVTEPRGESSSSSHRDKRNKRDFDSDRSDSKRRVREGITTTTLDDPMVKQFRVPVTKIIVHDNFDWDNFNNNIACSRCLTL